MSLGIQCPRGLSSYLSGYCYVETTAAEEIGVAPELLGGDIRLKTQPKIILINSGKEYTKADENIKKELKRREFCRKIPDASEKLNEKEEITKELEKLAEKSTNVFVYANYRDAYNEYIKVYEYYKEAVVRCKGYEYRKTSFS